MLPYLSVAYAGNLVSANAEDDSDVFHRYAIRPRCPYVKDVLFRKLRSRVLRSPSARSMTEFILHILLAGSPAQIIRAIVEMIAVPVGRLAFWVRRLSVKSRANETIHVKTTVAAYVDHQSLLVPFAKNLKGQDSTADGQGSAVLSESCPGTGFDTTGAGCLVTRKAWDWSPFFCYDIVSHFALLMRGGQRPMVRLNSPSVSSEYVP